MSNDDLRALSQTPFWEAVKEASKHEFWWYRRVEQLVGQELTYRVGAWSTIYASVCRFGPTFDHRHNYGNLLLVQVLLEAGADPRWHDDRANNLAVNDDCYLSLLTRAVQGANAAVLTLLLEDGRADPTIKESVAVRIACQDGRADMLKLFLRDGRATPPDYCLSVSTAHNHLEVTQILLKDGRIDPTDLNNYYLKRALRESCEGIALLLVSDSRVRSTMDTHEILKKAREMKMDRVVTALVS